MIIGGILSEEPDTGDYPYIAIRVFIYLPYVMVKAVPFMPSVYGRIIFKKTLICSGKYMVILGPVKGLDMPPSQGIACILGIESPYYIS